MRVCLRERELYLLKSFSVSSSSSPCPRRRRWRSSMSNAIIFSNSWFRAWTRQTHTYSDIKKKKNYSFSGITVFFLFFFLTRVTDLNLTFLQYRCCVCTWFECVTISVLCSGKLWYRLEMIWTATSVFPVPGGPTTYSKGKEQMISEEVSDWMQYNIYTNTQRETDRHFNYRFKTLADTWVTAVRNEFISPHWLGVKDFKR